MSALVTVAQLEAFDDIIDVRTPAEFAEDHIPGAKNFPVHDLQASLQLRGKENRRGTHRAQYRTSSRRHFLQPT